MTSKTYIVLPINHCFELWDVWTFWTILENGLTLDVLR